MKKVVMLLIVGAVLMSAVPSLWSSGDYSAVISTGSQLVLVPARLFR